MAKPKSKRKSRHYDEPGAYQRRQTERRERDEHVVHSDDDGDGLANAVSWWKLDGDACANAAWGWIDRLKKHHRVQSAMDAVWEAVYNDSPVGLTLDGSAALNRARTDTRIKLAKSMVGTMTSRISKRRPMPCISADDAGWSEKRYAQRASKVLRRKMGQSKVERLSPQVVRDGLIRGTGCWKVFRDGGDVGIERVPRREILVDPQESRYGEPRLMAQVKRVSRDVLCAMFPEHAAFIRAASRAQRDEWEPYEGSTDADQVDVGEVWKLPSVPGCGDGSHAIAMRGKLLKKEEWTRPRFPFAFFHWCPPVEGFWGTGLVSEAAPTQKEVNDTLKDMGEGISLAHQLKIFIQRGSNIDKNHLRARNPAVIEHDGQAPQYVAPLPFNMAVLEYLKWRIQQAYETCGISQASAASKNPLGSNASGKALDTMYDLESDRFADVELQYSQARVDLGQLMLDEARDIAACGEDDEGYVKPARWIERIDWEKLKTDEGDYSLVLEPVNFLPDARSGKLAHVKELADAGLLANPMQTAALFEEPDIARANRYQLGPYKRIEKWLEDLSNLDVPLEDCTPDPFLAARADMAKEMLLGELDMAIAEDADDDEDGQEVLGRYRWALQMLKGAVDELKQQEAQAAAPAPGAMPAMPPAGAPMDPMAAGGMPMDPSMMMPPIDPMGGATAQLAAGMPVDLGAMMQ